MSGQRVKLLLVYLYFAETLSTSNGNSTTVDVGVVPTPVPTASTVVEIFPEMTIQPSTTLASQNLLASSAAEKQLFTTIVPSGSSMTSLKSITSIGLSSLTVTVVPTPMTSDEITSTVSSTDRPETTYFTETTIVADSETTNKGTGGTEATMLLPISTEILALIAIGLGGVSCLCIVVFFLGCILMWTCRGCKKRCQKTKREIQDTMFRSATLQRPLGDTIRETFPMAIENPTYKDMPQGMDMTDASIIDRKESIISDNGYSG